MKQTRLTKNRIAALEVRYNTLAIQAMDSPEDYLERLRGVYEVVRVLGWDFVSVNGRYTLQPLEV